MGIPDGEMKAQLDGDTKDGGDDAEPVFNPFTQPFILLTLYILTILVLLVFFILLTIGAWNNESSFNALVQGTLISGAGKAVTALRQKSKAEDGESLEGLVDQILDGQKDAAAEAE